METVMSVNDRSHRLHAAQRVIGAYLQKRAANACAICARQVSCCR